ncbi:pyridoxal-dependent decarboxylase [Anaerolineales bacterium HSG6]|nr:pyridoxal-dependent decarboxylase [Anaerolineales bacterium HSG6]
MTDKTDGQHLAWFLGPKAEHGDMMEELMMLVLRDYIHWRRNYFPSDNVLINKKKQKEFNEAYDTLFQKTFEMMAQLRRNFPFYSPRYVGHMLSDVTIPSMLGYMAGMLYNPNNVTPEAAPVTVDWELEAANDTLRMLGYKVPPKPPIELDQNITNVTDYYQRETKREFGWAHITSGGTVANIEALWIARTVKYFPLSVREVALKQNIAIPVKRGDTLTDLRELSEREVLLLKPTASIYLLEVYITAVRKHYDIATNAMNEIIDKAWALLNDTQYSLHKGTGALFAKYQPVIFVSGAAHYSIKKAADILGIGQDNVVLIEMDSMFRMDMRDLERKINQCLTEEKTPLAVVAIGATTEEGAVDPIDKIWDLRRKMETEMGVSWWLHVDGAWGGYIRSLFQFDTADQTQVILTKIGRKLNFTPTDTIQQWHTMFSAEIQQRLHAETIPEASAQRLLRKLNECLSNDNLERYLHILSEYVRLFPDIVKDDFKITLHDRLQMTEDFVQNKADLSWKQYSRTVTIKWGDKAVIEAFMAYAKADSITVDPHKLGYVPYPCGVVAFRNDRVRRFITQSAPYITSVKKNTLIHLPPKYQTETGSNVVVESFAPFILEGSKPGAAAASLWLSSQMIPLNTKGHGQLIKASLLATRELYQWLITWDKIMRVNNIDTDYSFLPMTASPPDTNIVIFVVKKKTSSSLSEMNQLTEHVYNDFAIQAELGEQSYSYAQPFFLSKTHFSEPVYSTNTLSQFFERAGFGRNVHQAYKTEGMLVLRASVMNPYLHYMQDFADQNIIKELMEELKRSADKAVRKIG